jgi:hypothetical protein
LPRVSTIIPSRRECYSKDGTLNQTYKNLEVIAGGPGGRSRKQGTSLLNTADGRLDEDFIKNSLSLFNEGYAAVHVLIFMQKIWKMV